MGHFYILLTILFTVYGQLIIKQQVNTLTHIPKGIAIIPFYFEFVFTRPLVLSGFASAFLASMTWTLAISKFELSYAYPFMSLNFVLVVILSFFIFHDKMNVYKIIGLFFICLGIFILSKGR